MSDRAQQGHNPVAALSAFVRIGWDEFLTVIAVSLLTALAAIPIVTFGAAVIAGVDTLMAVLQVEGMTDPPRSLRARTRYFADSFTGHLLQGVLFGPVFLAVIVLAGTLVATFARSSATFLVGTLLLLYVLSLTLVWLYRSASVSLRSSDRPGPIGCLRQGLSHLLGDVSWTGLQTVYAATLWLLLVWTRVGALFLLAGLLAVLEVVSYEGRTSAGVVALLDDGPVPPSSR